MSRLESLADAVHVQLNDATVEKVIGERKDGRHGKRRRIHWYTSGGTYAQPSQSGGREIASGTQRAPAVWSRFANIVCRVHAESTATLDTLHDNLIVAISKVAANGGAVFDDYTHEYNEVAVRVPVDVVNFTIEWPVVDEVKPLVFITDEELTCKFEE